MSSSYGRLAAIRDYWMPRNLDARVEVRVTDIDEILRELVRVTTLAAERAAPTPPVQQDDEALELLRQAAHALDEAADSIADWASYASDYFREKHDYEGDLKRTRDAAAHFRALIAKRGAA